NETGYIKITGALGFPGLLFYLLWFWGILVFSRALLRSGDGVWKETAVLTIATAVGFLINYLTAPSDQSLFLSYIFPWLAGITIRQSVIALDHRVAHS